MVELTLDRDEGEGDEAEEDYVYDVVYEELDEEEGEVSTQLQWSFAWEKNDCNYMFLSFFRRMLVRRRLVAVLSVVRRRPSRQLVRTRPQKPSP